MYFHKTNVSIIIFKDVEKKRKVQTTSILKLRISRTKNIKAYLQPHPVVIKCALLEL
jgi:hypothetical protein